jgi:hypothetical protein
MNILTTREQYFDHTGIVILANSGNVRMEMPTAIS